MTATIQIRHLSNSSLAGQLREFPQAVVRIGRRPDNDIVFNPELDRTVSGHHCEVFAEAGRLYLVDRGSTNGTFVNGRRIAERTAVSDRDQIVLGERGPVIAVSLKSPDVAGPSTIMGAAVSGTRLATATGLLDADSDVSLPTQPAAASSAPPDGLDAAPADQSTLLQAPPPLPVDDGLAIGPITPQHVEPNHVAPDHAATPHTPRPPSRLSQGIKTSIGMNTLMAELAKATSRERRRVLLITVPLLLLLLASGLGAAWYFIRPGPPQVIVQPAPPAPAMTLPTMPPEWSAVLSPRKSSIYLVVVQRPGKEDRAIGTAWSVKKGLLATNAHVGEAFLEKEPNATLIARSNTNPPVDLKIVDATIHPGYQAFESLTRSLPPVDVDTGKPISLAMPFDAALFRIDHADEPKQTPALDLADDATLARVVETSELAYIGFPMEASVESGVNVQAPVAHQFVGNLSRKTDIFLRSTTEARATFLQYTLVVQGGASGSPVFNREGKVIGLISGNDHFFSSGGRIAITGKSFGPRVDAIRDLLDNTADATIAPYVAEWRTHFRAIFDKALAAGKYEGRMFQPAFGAFEVFGILDNPNNPTFKPTTADKKQIWKITISDLGDNHGKTVTSDPIDEGDGGVFCVVVWTDNPDVLPKVTVPSVESRFATAPPAAMKIFRDKLGQGSPFVSSWALPRRAGETFQFRVSGAGNGTTKQATFTAVLMKATKED